MIHFTVSLNTLGSLEADADADVSQNMFFLKFFCNIHKKTPVLDLFFYKVASLRACSFIKKRLQHSFFYRTPPLAAFGPQRISKRIILTKFWNLNMLPKDVKRSRKKHLHKKCTCFTSKKITKVAVFRWF